jgi:predicted O-methyltransferase YrrM
MTPGFEYCWQQLKVLASCPVALPDFCADLCDAEDARWRDMIAVEPPATTIHASPSEPDAAKYPEFANLATDVTLLRKRLKMTYLESLVLHREASRVPAGGKILEIGSGDGGSLAVISLGFPGELWAIDPFVPYDELARTLVRGVTEGNEKNFWSTAAAYGYGDRLRQIKKNSDVAAAECPDNAFDLILVDGNHSHKIAKADIEMYWPKVKPGGVMLIHDYTTRFPGVIQACQECGLSYSVFAGTSLAYARKAA